MQGPPIVDKSMRFVKRKAPEELFVKNRCLRSCDMAVFESKRNRADGLEEVLAVEGDGRNEDGVAGFGQFDGLVGAMLLCRGKERLVVVR